MSDKKYIPIHPSLIFYEQGRTFNIYLKVKDNYVLYAKPGMLSDKQKRLLVEYDVENLYISGDEIPDYKEYLKINYGTILSDDSVPMEERSKVFHDHTNNILKDVFDNGLPENTVKKFYDKIKNIVNNTYNFLISNPDSFNHVAKMVKYDYNTYSHSTQVFLYSMLILSAINEYDAKVIKQIGVGAMMHDLGKTLVSSSIINKPGKLTSDEFEIVKTHSAKGVALSCNINLPPITSQVILMHHEKLDGSGYPCAVTGEYIPKYCRVVTIADIYDALISKRPYADSMRTYDALKIMAGDVKSGKIDKDLFEIFIKLLSDKKII